MVEIITSEIIFCFRIPSSFNYILASIYARINSDDQFAKLEEVLAVGIQDDIFDENFAQEIKTRATKQMEWFKKNEIEINSWFNRAVTTK